MLQAVTKRQLWAVEDSGILDELPQHPVWHIKSVQDAIAWSYLHDVRGSRIGEVGGGRSRLLVPLAKNNVCFNFEPFEGRDGGPSEEVVVDGVTNIRFLVGDTEGRFPADTLDVLFSISVVEHIPSEALDGFFVDCARLLRPGGRMMHLVDIYVGDDGTDARRLAAYCEPFMSGLVKADGDLLDPDIFSFSCSFASNPDNMMRQWNRKVPELTDRRAETQGITLLMVGNVP